MKISCLQENLAKGLSIVGRAVAKSSSLPVLSNVLLQTEGDKLKLSATNLEIGINCWIGAKIEEAGAITIPARLLTDFVNTLPPERIDMTLDSETKTLNLQCARFESNIKGIDSQEFPIVASSTSGDSVIRLEPQSLRTMIEQVVFAAAMDESRPILTGVLVQITDDTLTMAAADGFRLSVRTATLSQNFGDNIEVIIPSRALMELARIATDQEQPVEVVVTQSRKQVLFHLENIDLVSQLIEGKFPDYNQIVPESHSTRSVMDTTGLLNAAKVCLLFARDTANIVKLDVKPSEDELMNGSIVMSAVSAELGDNVAEVDAAIEGGSMEIAFNAKYLIDVLSVLDGTQVVLETTASSSPGVLRALGDDDFTHVIMPMHITK